MLTPQPWAPRRAAITTIFKVFGITQTGIKPAIFHTRDRCSTTTSTRRCCMREWVNSCQHHLLWEMNTPEEQEYLEEHMSHLLRAVPGKKDNIFSKFICTKCLTPTNYCVTNYTSESKFIKPVFWITVPYHKVGNFRRDWKLSLLIGYSSVKIYNSR